MNILLVGSQGSGKTTQAALLVKHFNLYHLKAGDLLRAAAKDKPEINKIVNLKGDLVPDDLIFSVVTQAINKDQPQRDDILFDGYPRTVEQYLLLKDWLGQLAKKVDKAILLTVSPEEAIRRLSARRICKNCGKIWNLVEFPKPPSETRCDCGGELYQREDDKPELIAERLKNYDKITAPLIQTLEDEGKLISVGGEKSTDEVYEEIAKILNK